MINPCDIEADDFASLYTYPIQHNCSQDSVDSGASLKDARRSAHYVEKIACDFAVCIEKTHVCEKRRLA